MDADPAQTILNSARYVYLNTHPRTRGEQREFELLNDQIRVSRIQAAQKSAGQVRVATQQRGPSMMTTSFGGFTLTPSETAKMKAASNKTEGGVTLIAGGRRDNTRVANHQAQFAKREPISTLFGRNMPGSRRASMRAVSSYPFPTSCDIKEMPDVVSAMRSNRGAPSSALPPGRALIFNSSGAVVSGRRQHGLPTQAKLPAAETAPRVPTRAEAIHQSIAFPQREQLHTASSFSSPSYTSKNPVKKTLAPPTGLKTRVPLKVIAPPAARRDSAVESESAARLNNSPRHEEQPEAVKGFERTDNIEEIKNPADEPAKPAGGATLPPKAVDPSMRVAPRPKARKSRTTDLSKLDLYDAGLEDT